MKNQNIVDLDGDDSKQPKKNSNVVESELESNTNSSKRARNSTSNVWSYFKDIGIGKDGNPRAACIGCGKEYVAGGNKYGTSSISRHTKVCLHLKTRFQDVGNMLIDNVGKVRNRNISQKILREKIAMAIIKHDLPFSFVEYEGIRDVLRYCNPDVRNISRNTVASDVWKYYMEKKISLKQLLANIPSRIYLTSDVWTACTSEGYICLTTHFIDINWRLNNFILSFCDFPPPHSGVELARKVYDLLKEWGIDKKIFSITLDNASSNDNMQDILREQLCLQDSLLCNGEFFHICCSAHILNLIVQEGLKVANEALYKIRESVKYVEGSEGRMKIFEECVKQVGIEMGIHLRLDVSTRWNSTYMMLESALTYQRAFSSLSLNDRNYKYCPSLEEWTRGQKMFEFLRPFDDITNLISGSSYPTSNLYFMQVWQIECLLVNNANNKDIVIKDMVTRMKVKFDKYWKQYSVVLALGVVLDPRIKFQLLEMCYNEVDPVSSSEKMNLVKTKLFMLFEQYSKKSANTSSSSSHELASSDKASGGRLGIDVDGFKKSLSSTDVFKMFDSQVVTKTGKCQLDTYLDETKLEWSHFQEMDVLQYWRDNKYRFPELALMAFDVLSIPITIVVSESAFSIGARVLSKYMSCLLPKNVQALICARNWFHDFIPEDVDDEMIVKESTTSRVDSNVSEDEDRREDERIEI